MVPLVEIGFVIAVHIRYSFLELVRLSHFETSKHNGVQLLVSLER